MKRMEALADSIAAYNGFKDQSGELYQLRNPGGLKGFSVKHSISVNGFRVFGSFIDGYRALLYDLEKKCSGTSNCGLQGDSPLLELLRVYGLKDDTARYIVKYLRKALKDETLDANMPVSLFLEETN